MAEPRGAPLAHHIDASNEAMLSRRRALLPGGHGRSTFGVAPRIPYAIRGEGYVVEVDDGRRLIDFNNNFTALVHGHAHPEIVDAATRAVRDGASFGLPNFSELRHAASLLTRLPNVDQVRYTNSGTEAVMTAVRLARAHTGRDACIFVDATYHGTSDPALIPGGQRARRGIPAGVQGDVELLPINDVDRLCRTVEAEPRRFAAIVLDLIPNRAGLVPVTHEFLESAQRLRDDHGVLLVIDEVVSLRQAWEGLAAEYGARPDLMTLGKLIGGGHPVGAVVGKRSVMSELDPMKADGLEHGGTFTANPVTMEAGIAALDLLDPPAIARMNKLGERAREALRQRVDTLGWEVRGAGSLFKLHPLAPPKAVADLQRALWREACARDVLLVPNGLAAISTPMDEGVIDTSVDRLVDAVGAVAATRDLDRVSNGPGAFGPLSS